LSKQIVRNIAFQSALAIERLPRQTQQQ